MQRFRRVTRRILYIDVVSLCEKRAASAGCNQDKVPRKEGGAFTLSSGTSYDLPSTNYLALDVPGV